MRDLSFDTAVFLGLVIFIIANFAASAQVNAESAEEIQSKLIQRLSKLTNFVDKQAKSIELATPPKPSSSFENPKIGNKSMSGTFNFDPIKGNGNMSSLNSILKLQQIEVLQGNQTQLKELSNELTKAATEVSTIPAGQTIERLNSIIVPANMQKLLVIASDGNLQSLPPHLKLFSANTTAGHLVVGPGSAATVEYPSVVEVAYSWEGQGYSALCSGTLISADAVLTAAHCFCDFSKVMNASACMQSKYQRALEPLKPTDTKYVSIFFHDKGPLPVTEIIIHPQYEWPKNDLAMVRLAEPISDIMPAPLNDVGALSPNSYATIVGFGVHGPLDANGKPMPGSPVGDSQGLKLWATVKTAKCLGVRAGKDLICWNYQRPAVDLALGSTCHGDSGGPLFGTLNGNVKLVGVTSGGSNDCNAGSKIQSFDVDVYKNLTWIRATAGANSVPAFGGASTAFVSNPQSRAYSAPYHMFITQPDQWKSEFFLPVGLRSIRASINTTPAFSELRLELVAPGASAPACSVTSNDSFLTCVIEGPIAGTWKMSVQGAQPEESQLVATVSR